MKSSIKYCFNYFIALGPAAVKLAGILCGKQFVAKHVLQQIACILSCPSLGLPCKDIGESVETKDERRFGGQETKTLLKRRKVRVWTLPLMMEKCGAAGIKNFPRQQCQPMGAGRYGVGNQRADGSLGEACMDSRIAAEPHKKPEPI
jgi:hypothetical protein